MKNTCIPTGLSYLILIPLWVLAACSPSTNITASWKNPDAEANKSDIQVAALTRNMAAKTTVERELTAELRNAGLDITTSGELFAPNFTDDISASKEALLSKIRENGNDAILTVTLLDQQTETRYVPGSSTYAPTVSYGFYGGFYSYYNYRYPVVYDPGYYTQDKTYFLETNLYDVQTEELLWSAQSKTYNPTNLDKFAEEFAKITVARLKSEGLI
ncbi:hypothetical protein WJR50_26200 [Catalinimonas sp. 4WD22]|uniref:hypothetical protein n=1 Tax=Catalinimonas locisalis TaxID=3133978 RepID=UPI0031017AA9